MKRYGTYYINDAVIIRIGSLALSDADRFAIESYRSVGLFAYLLDGGFVEAVAPYNRKIAAYMTDGMKRGMMFFIDLSNPA